MRLRRFSCPSCGASREAREDAVVLVCAYCGEFLALDTSSFFRGRGLAEYRERCLAGATGLDPARARKDALASEMAAAEGRGDREAWRRAAEEFYALLAALEPWVAPAAKDPASFGKWHRDAVAMAEFLAFCPEAKAAQSAFVAVASRLGRGEDPVLTARRMLEEAEAYGRTIAAHPEYPGDPGPASIAHRARQMVRAAVTGLEAMLGPGVALRIYREVLGDAVVPGDAPLRCASCGSGVDPRMRDARALACPFCGAVIHLEGEDPWLLNSLALWETVRAGLGRDGRAASDQDVAMSAFGILLNPLWMGGEMAPEPAVEFLRRAVPGVGREPLLRAARLFASTFGGDPRKAAFFEGLIRLLEAWVPSTALPT